MNWRYIASAVLLVVLILGTLGCVLLLEWRSAKGIVPPAEVIDVHSFLEWRPMTERFFLVRPEGGEEHVMATGEDRFLASGASAYVFDRSGRLVEWSYDIGDDPKFDRHWNAQRGQSGDSITADAIDEWIESHTPDSDSTP